jgi:nitronate monooxygenase
MKKEEEIRDRYLSYIEAGLSEDCNIFTTSGYRAPFITRRVNDAGGIWIHKCTLLHHALSAEKEGADAITILGIEGTGFKHPASNSTLVNLTMAKKALKIPFIAAGGIGDARGFLGALALGADGVCLGTALMATEECPVPKRVKERWINTDIYTEDFHHQIYTYNTKNFMAPSTAIAHRSKIITIQELFDEIIIQSEKIINSWGFNNNEFSTLGK